MSKHLKRRAAPRTVRLHRKEHTWTIKPSPGPHPLEHSLALGLIIRDYLKLCDTYKEAKQIITNREILVDGKIQTNYKHPCGLMDIITIPKLKTYYRILFDQNGKLTLVDTTEKDATWKLCRIQNTTILRGNKIQLNLHDGRNTLVTKNEYNTGDVLKLTLADNKISEVYKFEKGTISLITGGSHIGQVASIQDIHMVPSSRPNLAIMKGTTEFSTITDYIFPIGKTKPTITLPEVKIQ